jgi:hypothetical protein
LLKMCLRLPERCIPAAKHCATQVVGKAEACSIGTCQAKDGQGCSDAQGQVATVACSGDGHTPQASKPGHL